MQVAVPAILRFCVGYMADYIHSFIHTHRWITLNGGNDHFHSYMRVTNSTENVTPPKSSKYRNSNSSVQMKSKSQFGFVSRDTEKSEFLDLVDFGSVAISVESVIGLYPYVQVSFDFFLSCQTTSRKMLLHFKRVSLLMVSFYVQVSFDFLIVMSHDRQENAAAAASDSARAAGIHIYVYIYIYINMYICMCVCIFIYTYILTYMCAYMHTYAHTNVNCS